MSSVDQSLHKRLYPLYLAAFLQGCVLWYAVEKLFMKSIGYDDGTIGVMIAFYSALMLIAETPSGILADRWSRKGVLILSAIGLILSTVVGGISDNVPMYLLSAAFWGISFALYSGTYDSIVYDTLLEHGKKGQYERYFGRVKVMESVALVIGSLLGGVIGRYLGLRWTYFLTIPLTALTIVALIKFREPQLHKAQASTSIKEHVASTFRAVLRRGSLLPTLVVLVVVSALTYTLYEFGQLWAIALAAPVILFGPINALHLSTIGLGSAAASRLKLHNYPVMLGALGLALLAVLGLTFLRNLPLIVGCIVLLSLCLAGINVVFTKVLHDSLESKVRAGAASAISTMGRLIIIPIALSFGYISDHATIFAASWLLVALVVVLVAFVLRIYAKTKTLPAVAPTQPAPIDDYSK